MILLYNVYITGTPANDNIANLSNIRGNLAYYDKLEIAKYCLSSLAVAYPWSKVILNIELEPSSYNIDDYKKLGDFISNEFKNTNVIFSPERNVYQHQWMKTYDDLDDDIICYFGNHDHIFIDSDNSYLKELVEVSKQYNNYSTIAVSHFPENIRWAKSGYIELNEYTPRKLNNNYKLSDNHLSYRGICVDSMDIITKELYHKWFFTGDWGEDTKVPRTEGIDSSSSIDKIFTFFNIPLPQQDIIIPLKEQFRHFDGYMHQRIPNNICPSLCIPKGFFESKIKIRYGYDDYKEGWVNINPKNPNYYAFDKTGTDYKITLEDIPLFWKNKIIEIDKNPNINEEEMIQHKLQSILQMMYFDQRYNPYIEKEVEQKVLNTYLRTHKQYNLV